MIYKFLIFIQPVCGSILLDSLVIRCIIKVKKKSILSEKDR